ncbi:uncharacterized protein LOC123879326 [Maniola jurtina]|uniref:uncharacterized protein LOC123879326 n=1 Tax=Maniola jurtina TaxID=191418 RepID=UPI001E68EE9C|nr:uncharacterized protein LOC123879326 [Maniola jurtina]
MRCCVPYCENTSTNVSTSESKGISFHGLPSDVPLRAAWLRALGKQDSQLPDSAVVCSQHFLDDEMYETESGLRHIATGAVPSTVQVCMICLDTDSKLYLMSKHKLEEAYERLTGYPLYDQGNLKQTLCVQCAQRLINFSRFRDKSLRARALMMDLVEKHELITRRHIKGINRTKNQLKSNFVMKTLGPDHCDLYILDSTDKQTESEPIGYSAVVKNEESFDSPVDEDMEVAEEDDNTADNVNDELDACKEECFSEDSIMLETKLLDDVICKALENPVFAEQVAEIPDLLKCESAAFQCTLCSEEFVSEHAYMQHMHMHDQQNSDGNADCSTSQVCKPHTAVSSSHSPCLTENKQAIPLSQASSLSAHSPSAHSPQTAVAPLSARLAPSNGNKVQAEDADTVQKSKPLFKINNVELNNQLFDTNNVTDINRLTDCVVILYDIFKKPEEGVPIQGESLATMRPSISSWDSQRHIEKASKDFNCQAVSRNEDTRHTIGDIQPVTNKLKVTELNVTKTSQSKSYCSNNYNSEDSLLTDKNGYICDVCRHKFKRKSVLVKHIKTHNEVKPFTFEFCQFKAIHKFSLKKHMQTHTGDKPFTCELCDYKCTQNSNLVRHMRTHTGEKPFTCEFCDYKCAQSSHLVRHMRTHTGEKPFTCELCDYKCAQNSCLVQHMTTHTGDKPFTCELCDYTCAYSSHLVRHMRTHTGEKPFTCELCDYKCAQNSSLVQHMRTHTGEKPYVCKLCDHKFALSSHLVRHMSTHTGEKPFTCELCDYKCAQNSHLVQHMRTHTGEKPYVCKFCDYKFAGTSHLVRHMRTHTGEKPYICKFCDHKFARTSQLVSHMRTHTGEKPYVCKLCDYKFAQTSHLVRHMSTHTGEKPFTCELCDYKCAQNSSLVRHMRTHTGEKPFACELCDYKCARKSSLARHRRTHTDTNPPSCSFPLLSARLATNNGNKVQAEDADTVQKSKQLFKIYNIGLNNQLFNTNNITDINRLTDCVVILYDIFKKPQEGVPIQGESLATMRPNISSWDSQCHVENASKDCNCQAVSRNKDTRHTIGDIRPVINKLKVTELNATKTSQSKTYCSNNYNSEDSLLTDKNGYICDVCRHKFKRKSVLVKHIKTHSEVKPFTCKFCQFQTKYKCSLKTHMRTHTVEKPFTCELCDYKFAQVSHLLSHMRTHMGLCDYKCARTSHLVTHMRTHTGEKPFACELCDYKCARKSSLARHRRTHTDTNPPSCSVNRSLLATFIGQCKGWRNYKSLKMRCCVPFCTNTPTNVSTSESKGISFHALPSDVRLRAAWLRALGKQDSQLPDSAVVCSQHFLDDEMYETESGLRQIATGAVPSTVQVCMICLNTDNKLYLMSKHKLEEAYERLTGYPLYDQGNLKRTLCVQCAQRLINFSRFRDKSLRARALMMDLVEKHELITRQHIKGINRTKNQLKSNFVMKTLGPDHCDLYILDSSDKQTESEPIGYSAVVKNEESFDSPVDEDMEVAEEDDNTADNVNDELDACKEECFSDDSIMLETKLLDDVICKALENPVFAEQVAEIPDLLKCESAAFQCTLCSEEFVSEHAYMQHMHMHDQQNSDGYADCSTSQVCKPHTAVSSSHSPHLTENKQAIPLSQALSPSVHSSSAHSPQTAVAPLSARLATSNGNKVQAEDADTVQKSEPLFKINNVGLNNQLFDTNNITDINRLTDCVVILYDIFKKPEEGVPIQGESLATMRPSISSWDSQRHIEKASKDFNCQAVTWNEATRHTIGDIQPVTNKLKVTELNATKTSQSKTYCSNNYNSEDSLLTEKNGYICDVCRHKFKRKSLLVKHIKTHSEVKPFTCEFCQFKAIHKFSLKKHMQTHTGDKLFTCALCDYKCTHSSKLVQHMRTHTGEKPYICKFCDYKFVRPSQLVSHMRTHTGEKPFTCEFCDYKCALKYNLARHKVTHTGEKPFTCELCDYKCAQNSNLVQHMRTHTGEKPYVCKLCDYKFARTSHLVRHMRTHNREKPYICKFCDYKCALKCNLARHKLTHTGEKPFTCELCDYKCAQNSNLVSHMRTHTGEKPYVCKLCDYKFARTSHLVRHMRTHTGEKPYICKFCDYKFARTSQLVSHMRTHTGEKPYVCKLCDYAQSSHLVRHMSTHTGEKPFTCELCDYKCAQNSSLVQHMRTHTGEKPFTCELCHYKCARKSNLARHKITHTDTNPPSCS